MICSSNGGDARGRDDAASAIPLTSPGSNQIIWGKGYNCQDFPDDRAVMEALFIGSPDGILITDSDWNLVNFNGKFAELWQVSIESLCSQEHDPIEKASLFGQKLTDQRGFIERLEQIRSNPHEEFTDRLELQDGRILERHSIPITSSKGRHLGRVWYFRDITHIIKEHFQQLQDRTDAMQREKRDSLNAMAGSVAHHVNNHLFTIRGNLELAAMKLEQADIPSCRRFLRRAEGYVERAVAFTTKILTYLGYNSIQRSRIRADRFMEQVLASLEGLEEGGRVVLKPGPKVHLEIDVNLMCECLKSIIFNSLEALGDRPGRVVVGWSVVIDPLLNSPALPLLERGRKEGTFVALQVTDDGPGMDRKALARAFDPFFTTKEFGRGLGLSSVLGITHSHGGFVNVESDQQGGTTVTIYLPAEEGPSQDPS